MTLSELDRLYTDGQRLITVNLSFFAEGSGGEKTEAPTGKRRNKARQEGQVALSPEVATAFNYIVMFACIKSFAPQIYESLSGLFLYTFDSAETYYDMFDVRYAVAMINFMFKEAIFIALPILLVAMMVGIVSCLPQVGWHPTTKPLMPKLSKLNPISGIKRMFSFTTIMNLLKSIIKMAIIGTVIYSVIKDEINELPGLVNLSLMEAVIYIGDLAVDLGITVGGWFIAVAIADYAYTRFKHEKDLKMTKQEVKQEYKEAEGDPLIKGKIKHKMQEASMRRMMQSIPQADVIITNPTHYAVAVKYDREGDTAPVVVAKGVDFLAAKIKDIAKENRIEIVENKPLARALYASVDIGKEIPQELYQAVAEILAFVYRLKKIV